MSVCTYTHTHTTFRAGGFPEYFTPPPRRGRVSPSKGGHTQDDAGKYSCDPSQEKHISNLEKPGPGGEGTFSPLGKQVDTYVLSHPNGLKNQFAGVARKSKYPARENLQLSTLSKISLRYTISEPF